MGKVMERITLTNVFDPSKTEEVNAVIDTGATMLVLPKDLVERLGLRKVRDARVRYANQEVEVKSIYGVVALDIQGRVGNFDVLAEVAGSQPLVGQIVLEELDLVIHPATRQLTPNPDSPEMPMVEIL
ncbi:MAG: aspartyl protease family protein [candidate division NC10 bacterium]|nr:aspartyl protease family protein [candidate division NC10 bacterium]